MVTLVTQSVTQYPDFSRPPIIPRQNRLRIDVVVINSRRCCFKHKHQLPILCIGIGYVMWARSSPGPSTCQLELKSVVCLALAHLQGMRREVVPQKRHALSILSCNSLSTSPAPHPTSLMVLRCKLSSVTSAVFV